MKAWIMVFWVVTLYVTIYKDYIPHFHCPENLISDKNGSTHLQT
jgi:hypothetical protein